VLLYLASIVAALMLLESSNNYYSNMDGRLAEKTVDQEEDCHTIIAEVQYVQRERKAILGTSKL